jgi:2-C-methyl-D-erythritol 4-phosphate cytidylyltransferase
MSGTNIAIILAGGHGERFKGDIPKQFINLNGVPIIKYSIDRFSECNIECVVVAQKEWHQFCEKLGVRQVVLSGDTRNRSSYNGLLACAEADNVLIHDAVRPFIDIDIINKCLAVLRNNVAVGVAIGMSDTIVKVSDDNIVDVPDRKILMRSQTPQAFKYSVIMDAYNSLGESAFELADDIAVVTACDVPCKFVDGSEWNMKITYPPDLFIAERIMQYQEATSVKSVNLKDKSILVFGGSGGIGSEVIKQLQLMGANVIAPTHKEVDLSREILPTFLDSLELDVIIQCAGVIYRGFEHYDETMNINFRSALLIVDLAKRTMPSGGSIIFVGSSSAMKGRKDFPIYSASKAALNNFVEGVAESMLPYNIRINCVNPARTNTRMTDYLGVTGEGGLDVSYVAKKIIDYCGVTNTGQIFNIRRGLNG